MIQSNELRSGNLIIGTYENEDDNLMHETICTFKFYNCYDNYYNVESKDRIEEFTSFKPIPLTEEILLKCGAKKTDKEDSFGGFIIYYPNGNGMRIKNNEWSNQHITVKIEFLHQLQNLYWCLCGKELTFNNL